MDEGRGARARVDRRAAAAAIEAFLRALGHEPQGELEGTGERVAEAWAEELLAGEGVDLGRLLREGSSPLSLAAGGSAGLVVARELSLTTVCPHHLLPAQGRAFVAYLPGQRLAGVGTLAALVEACARRLTLQERLGEEVVQALHQELGARGAACRLVLSHACLTARGRRQTEALVETVALAGCFSEPGADRELALRALGVGQ